MQSALERTGLKLKIEVVGIPSGEDWGTADALRFLQDSSRIKVSSKIYIILYTEYKMNNFLGPHIFTYNPYDLKVKEQNIRTINSC